MSTGSRRQLVFALSDQVVSSGSNILFLLIMARVSDGPEFGQFSLVYAFFILAIGLGRALVTDPLLVSSRSEVSAPAAHYRSILGASLTGGAVAGLLVGALAPMTGDPSTTFVVAVALPALALQDSYRALAFFERRAGLALAQDTCWVAVQLVLTAAFALSTDLSSFLVALAWGVGGLASTLASAVASRTLPGRGGLRWVRSRARRGLPMSVEFLSGQGSLQLSLVFIASTVGPNAMGSLRIVMLALSPLNPLAQGTYGWAMPRLASQDFAARRRLGIWLTIGLGAAGVLLAVTLLMVPHAVWEGTFGRPWTAVTPMLLVWACLDRVLATVGLPLAWTARAHGRTSPLAWTRLTTGLLMVVAATALSARWDVVGAAIGLTFSGLVATALLMRLALVRGPGPVHH